MSNEELVQLYRQGNKNAMDKLLEANKGMIYKIVNKFYINSNSIDKEDLIQEGYLGLMRAVEKYENNLNCKFSTYSFYWVFQKIQRFLEQKSTNEEISLNEPVKKEEGNGDNLIDFIQDHTDDFKTIEDKIYYKHLATEIDHILSQYTTLEQRNIINLHYGLHNIKPNTFQEVSNILELDFKKVRAEENRAFKKIRITRWGIETYNKLFGHSRYESYSNVEKWIMKKDEEQKYRLLSNRAKIMVKFDFQTKKDLQNYDI